MSNQIINMWGQPPHKTGTEVAEQETHESLARSSRIRVYNTYGVTEATVYNTMHLVRRDSSPRYELI